MRRVIVVESGAKTKTIRRFVRGEYDVVACGGHVADLPDDELGIDVDGDFAYRLEPLYRRGRSAVETVRAKLEDADEIYLATDPDREGEAIAADLAELAIPEDVPTHRITFNAIVYHAIQEALEDPRDIDEDLVEAQRARRALDRLVGFVLSAIAQHDPDGPNLPSVGRVQSPAVALVVDREREIEDFEPRRYWTVQAEVGVDGDAFRGDVVGDWDGFDDAKAVVDDLTEAGELTVDACEEDPHDEMSPLPPYTTDMLQDDADAQLGFSPERTMELAQQLYEGVEVQGTTRALITYMRTDSTRVSPTALNYAKQTLAAREGLGEETYKGRPWSAGEGSQDAHEAIRPTEPHDEEVWPEALEGEIDEDLLAVYELVYWRFLASQMQPAVYHTTRLELGAAGQTVEAEGHRLKELGFLAAMREIRPDHGRREVDLPGLEVGSTVALDRPWPEPEETRPPPRYREGSLVRKLKELGIGRPSTYGDILAKIKRSRYGYVRKQRGTLRPTERGEALCSYLRDRFERVIDYEYTAEMEAALDRIEEGELSYEAFLEREFAWLREPYQLAKEEGWMDEDRPSPAQLDYLEQLADETGQELPDEAVTSKAGASEWIDKLRDAVDPVVRISPVHEAVVGDVDVWRFNVYFNRPLPDEEYEWMREKKMRYQEGGAGSPPHFRFQRQDRAAVASLREELVERYREEVRLDEFEVEILDDDLLAT